MQATKMPSVAEMFMVKIGENPLRIEVRTFAKIKKVIWDQLLATKAEIIQSKLFFVLRALCLDRLAVRVSDYILCRALNEHHNCVIQRNIPFESIALIKPDEDKFYTQ